jgi:hypothetical protein
VAAVLCVHERARLHGHDALLTISAGESHIGVVIVEEPHQHLACDACKRHVPTQQHTQQKAQQKILLQAGDLLLLMFACMHSCGLFCFKNTATAVQPFSKNILILETVDVLFFTQVTLGASACRNSHIYQRARSVHFSTALDSVSVVLQHWSSTTSTSIVVLVDFEDAATHFTSTSSTPLVALPVLTLLAKLAMQE